MRINVELSDTWLSQCGHLHLFRAADESGKHQWLPLSLKKRSGSAGRLKNERVGGSGK